MNLAPTASTTATLALGDALAMALSRRKGFREEQFAHLHPGGRLGKRLMRVEALMHAGDALPRVAPDDADAGRHPRDVEQAPGHDLRRRRRRPAGGHRHRRRPAAPHDARHRTCSSRRAARRHDGAARSRSAGDMLAVEALRLMEERKITAVVVVDDARRASKASCTCTTSGGRR